MENNNIILAFVLGLSISLIYILLKQNKQTSMQKNVLTEPNADYQSRYKNNEKWNIIRDENGNLVNIEIIRDAKVI
jgi:hypothetical protein